MRHKRTHSRRIGVLLASGSALTLMTGLLLAPTATAHPSTQRLVDPPVVNVQLAAPLRNLNWNGPQISVFTSTTTITYVLPVFPRALNLPGLHWTLIGTGNPGVTTSGNEAADATSFTIPVTAAQTQSTGFGHLYIVGGNNVSDQFYDDQVLIFNGVSGPTTVVADVAHPDNGGSTKFTYLAPTAPVVAAAGSVVHVTVPEMDTWGNGPSGNWHDVSLPTGDLDQYLCSGCGPLQLPASVTVPVDGLAVNMLLPTTLYAGRETTSDATELNTEQQNNSYGDTTVSVYIPVTVTGGLSGLMPSTGQPQITAVSGTAPSLVVNPGTWVPVHPGTWDQSATTYAVQWYRGGAPIAGTPTSDTS